MSEVIQTTIDRGMHTVLVVDDQPATRYSTGRILRAAGFKTADAGSGTEALNLVAAGGISAVVLDVHLPDIDGFEVCRSLRSRPLTQMLPVVHLSAEHVRAEDQVTGLNAGADAYLVHPVEPAILIATIQALIRARTAEDDLRRSENRFRAIFDRAPTGIALVTPDGRFADVNPAMEALLGYQRDALAGRPVSELAQAGQRNAVATRFTSTGGEGWRGELPLVDARGKPVQVEWTVSLHSDLRMQIAVATDVTERHALDARRREVLEREQAARGQAERHNRTKDDFIAVLSHELRTPLNAIMGWVHVLMRTVKDPAAGKGLAAIERSVKTQARIIADILDVSRINAGKLRLELEQVDPAPLVSESIEALRNAIDEKSLRIHLQVTAGEPMLLDSARFQQIVWNLVTNAIKFSRPGGEVRVSLDREGSRLRLTVQDFGQGIEADFVAHLFDRFTQSDAPGNRRHGGLGLGLSIVKHLAEMHHGSVRASSPGPGLGATFVVELDPSGSGEAAASQPAPLELPGSAPEPHREAVLAGMDILIVEDEADSREMLTLILGDHGARVRQAADVPSALAALREAPPHAIVCDIGLPGRDGYDLIREVRAGGNTQVAAVALTAFARPEDQRRALEAGFDLHVTKPLRPHMLLDALLRARELRRADGQGSS